MSKPTPPNLPENPEYADYLRAAQEVLEKLRARPKPPDSLIKVDDEKKTLELDKLKIENRRLTIKVEEAEDLHKVRKRYTNRLFWLIVFWLFAVVLFIGLAGFKARGFTLSDSVIIAFITSTTVSVLGLFLIPAKWLFPSKEESEN